MTRVVTIDEIIKMLSMTEDFPTSLFSLLAEVNR